MIDEKTSPVFVGGVGGSGTRVVTEILKQMGIFMGANLNNSNDYLEFSRLGAKLRQLMQESGEATNDEILDHVHSSLDELKCLIFKEMEETPGENYCGWGWKTPPNFIILEHLNSHFDGMKYIHVIRHGLDMAFSSNLNQLKLWGFYFGIDQENMGLHQAALKYWIAANKYAIRLAQQLLNDRFLLLKYEDLCLSPDDTISKILKFLDVKSDKELNVSKLVCSPGTIGRSIGYPIHLFEQADLQEVAQLGFEPHKGSWPK